MVNEKWEPEIPVQPDFPKVKVVDVPPPTAIPIPEEMDPAGLPPKPPGGNPPDNVSTP